MLCLNLSHVPIDCTFARYVGNIFAAKGIADGHLIYMMMLLSTLQMLGDADAINSILGSLPGVNPDDPALQTALRNLQGSGDKDSKGSDKKDSK